MGFDIVTFISENLTTISSSVISVGIAVISAIFLRKKTKTEAETKELEKIKAAKFKEVADIMLDSGMISHTEFFKIKNYTMIAKKADEIYKKNHEEKNIRKLSQLPQHSLDWHVRFFEASGYISDEEIQNLWARILAGEIEQPGSYSLRTIECLRNLSKKEAELFKKICEYSIRVGNDVILPRENSYLTNNGISYDDIITLSDCGIMNSDGNLSKKYPENGNQYYIITHSDSWVLFAKKKLGVNIGSTGLMICDYLFTKSGTELYSVLIENDNRDFSELQEVYSKAYTNFDFFTASIIKKGKGDFVFQIPFESEKSNQ